MSEDARIREITAAGAGADEVDELLAYNANHFDVDNLAEIPGFPLDDEPMVDCWRGWAEEAESAGAVATLRRYLPQLSFPVADGMSQHPDYRKATLSGAPAAELDAATGLELQAPDRVELKLYPSLAGRIPVLEIRDRATFLTLVQALSARNEPRPVPESMGAQMIGGFNNWHRIHAHQRRWLDTPAGDRGHATWPEAFADLRRQKDQYQDRFILLSDGPYSAVDAAELGLDDGTWRRKSLVIRREHECTHYFTRRVFGSMRANLLDELLCDYAGIVAAEGRFRGDWFLRFVGLEDYPTYRRGGRLENYLGDPPLTDGAFRALQTLVVRATANLERFDRDEGEGEREPRRRALILAALATQRLDELASEEGVDTLRRALDDLDQRFPG
ncbi:MAG: flagellar basal body-associated FliL family protein [Acidobacteriota bacterium]